MSLLLVVLDQITKALASQYLQLHDAVAIFPGLNLTLMHNTGAAFSMLSQAGGWQRWFFIILTFVISVVLINWLKNLPAHDKWMGCALALILGGAIGNLWDRMVLGYVIDFIDVYYRHLHWPAFNIADSAITVGAIMLIIDTLRPSEREENIE